MDDSLASLAARHGIRLNDGQIGQFARYLALLREWSSRVNLVGNEDESVVVSRHFVESLALGAALRQREVLRPDSRVLDVGAGAGFPGLPIKIGWPSIDLTLIEATARKTAFMEVVLRELDLDGVSILTGRAETFGHAPDLREAFDLVLARAVAPLPVLLELTMPFARVGGRVVTVKGSRTDEEIAAAGQALTVLGGQVHAMPFDVPGPAQQIVAVVKRTATPDRYPRRTGVPARSPL